MKFLVISHTHSLLPFAYRLQLQGHEVQPVVVVSAFEAAWRGKMEPSPRDGKGRLEEKFIKSLVDEVGYGNPTVVVTDDWKLQQMFKDATTHLFGVHQQHHTTSDGLTGPLRLGGWFDGTNLQALHLLVIDRGAWPQGMGPEIDGSLTMVRIDQPETIQLANQWVETQVEELKSSGFRGLVQFNLNFQTSTGQPEIDGHTAGWPFLHCHAFLSELEDFAGLLSGDESSPTHPPQLLPRKFVTVLPVSRPPWPTRKARFRFELAPIEGLTPEQMGRAFWHDVQLDPEAGKLTTAGLDGLVGVVRGAADTSELARARALEVALRLQLKEKQFRSDAGTGVQSVLAEFERRFGVLL